MKITARFLATLPVQVADKLVSLSYFQSKNWCLFFTEVNQPANLSQVFSYQGYTIALNEQEDIVLVVPNKE